MTTEYDKELEELMEQSGGDSDTEYETLSLTSGRDNRDFDEESDFGYLTDEDVVLGRRSKPKSPHACV